MAGIPKVSSSFGTVPGKTHEEAMVCQYAEVITSKGYSWFGGEPFSFTLPVLLIQLFDQCTSYCKPLPHSTFISRVCAPSGHVMFLQSSITTIQKRASMIIAHSFLMRKEAFSERLFPPGGRIVFETIASLGFMLHLFILGVQVDASLVMKAGRNAVLIGFTGFALPYALSWLAIVTLLSNLVIPDDRIKKTLPFIAALNSMSSSPVITSLLADLKILSSELGCLAASTALVCDVCSYFIFMMVATVGVAIRDVELKPLYNILWTGAFIVLVLFVFRPIIVKIGKRIPKGQPMKESQFFAILLVVLVCGFCAQTLGQSSGLASSVLGVSMPGGPPLGSSLVNKLDTIATGILLPAKVAMSGLSVDLFSIGRGSSGLVLEFFIILGYVGKFIGTFIPAIYNCVPFKDAVSLA
ncbi:hypothetical protein RJ639_045391 [Escallonia herrerae]|uniref:Cation/H+ exchanger transmembrane domain-containing protein n=1 Tax=Escallonia herrerae TaxID=1293975 RepID=A0AA88W967_9ASTE|nr:hypothetical protein RJ639_045391 [Escallonia herrerae]